MLKYLLIIIMLMGSQLLTAEEKIFITSGEWSPHLSENLEHYGFGSMVVTEAFNAAGITVNYGFFPWKRSYLYAENLYTNPETWAGTILWVKSPERDRKFIYSDPVLVERQVLIQLKADYSWNQLTEGERKTIGIMSGSYNPVINRALLEGKIFVIEFRDYPDLLQKTLEGHVDASIIGLNVGLYYFNNNLSDYEKTQLNISDTPLETRNYHLMINRNYPNADEIISRFNMGLKELKQNSRYAELKQKFDIR